MDVSSYVSTLGREFTTLADTGGDEARAVVERLAGSLEPAIRMTLLDALSAAAAEITRELAPGSVELRLRGRDALFVVTAPPTRTVVDPAGHGPSSRINVRLPDRLRAVVEEAAAGEGRSVNAWLVRAATAAVAHSDLPPREGGRRARQHLTGWVR